MHGWVYGLDMETEELDNQRNAHKDISLLTRRMRDKGEGEGEGKGIAHPSSAEILACLKYFIPTQATTTQTQAMTAVSTIKAG